MTQITSFPSIFETPTGQKRFNLVLTLVVFVLLLCLFFIFDDVKHSYHFYITSLIVIIYSAIEYYNDYKIIILEKEIISFRPVVGKAKEFSLSEIEKIHFNKLMGGYIFIDREKQTSTLPRSIKGCKTILRYIENHYPNIEVKS